MKRNVLKYLSVVIIMVLTCIAGYFAQKEYYTQKAIENTRFITIIKNAELNIITTKFENLINTTMKNVVWKQSKIKSDKYFVTCTGDYHDINVRMEFYIHEGEKSNKTIFDKNRFYIRKEGKIVQRDYALYIISSDFMEKKNMVLPTKVKVARDISIILSNNMPMSKYEIDYDVFTKTMDDVENLDALSIIRIGSALNKVLIDNGVKTNNETSVEQQNNASEQTSGDPYENNPELNEYD